MAPPAKSRKGKKAWRKNIDATEVEEFVAEQTYQERRGPAARDLKDDQLFFVDTSADVEGAAAVADGKRLPGLAKKRRLQEERDKPLRAELVLAQAHQAKPVALAPPVKKQKDSNLKSDAGKGGNSASGQVVPVQQRQQRQRQQQQQQERHPLDLWGDEDLLLPSTSGGAAVAASGDKAPKRQRQGAEAAKERKQLRTGAGQGAALREMGPSAPRLRGMPPPAAARMRAVQVDVPGCSFNPDREQQQDALALLVAREVQRELAKELAPAPVPRVVDALPGGGAARSELDELQVDAEASEEAEEDEEAEEVPAQGVQAADAAAGQQGGGAGGARGLSKRQQRQQEKKTKKERQKEARRRASDKEAAGRAALKAQRRGIDALPALQRELEEQAEERELKRLRLVALREDRAAVEPPRLGKQRFEPPMVQVLLSEEMSGSLRQLRPCSMLATERFKSLQQRGVIEPRKPQQHKEKRRKVMYEKGARAERQLEATQEVRVLEKRNVQARRQLKRERQQEDDE